MWKPHDPKSDQIQDFDDLSLGACVFNKMAIIPNKRAQKTCEFQFISMTWQITFGRFPGKSQIHGDFHWILASTYHLWYIFLDLTWLKAFLNFMG